LGAADPTATSAEAALEGSLNSHVAAGNSNSPDGKAINCTRRPQSTISTTAGGAEKERRRPRLIMSARQALPDTIQH
jgi:hypothetical protein